MARTAKPLDDERGERLLMVAADAFLADGYEGASLNKIIDEAGLAKSSFYHYFNGKRDLYDHLFETLRDLISDQTSEMNLESLTPENFWTEFDGTLRGLGSAPSNDLARLALTRLFHAHSHVDERFRQLHTTLVGGLGSVLARGRELGVVRDDLPLGLIVELAAGWLFAVDRWAVNQRVSQGADRTALAAADGLRVLYGALAGE